jgi:hypothetical protein
MTLYQDCEDYFAQALASPRGIAVTLDTPGQAISFIQRMNTHRVRTRKLLEKTYPEDHPQHGKTPWDHLVLRRDKENKCVARIEPAKLEVKGVVEL